MIPLHRILIALCLAAAAVAAPAQETATGAGQAVAWESLEAADQIALLRGLEARRVAGAVLPRLWAGFEIERIPTLLFRSGRIALLVGHPDPPDGYRPLTGSPAAVPVHVLLGEDRRLVANTALPIRGVVTALADLGSARGGADAGPHPPAESVIARILHETFHAFAAGKPAKQFPGGAWDRYPDAPATLARLNLEGRILAQALEAPDDEARRLARWFVAVRLARWSEVGPGLAVAEAADEFEEGLATYTEWQAISRAAEAGPPIAGLASVDGAFSSYRFARVLRLESLAPLLDLLDGFEGVRDRGYLAGAVQATLLDRLDPQWRGRAFQPDVSLIDLLAAACGFAAADPAALLREAEQRFAFPALQQLAQEDFRRIESRRARVMEEFLEQPGFLVKVHLPDDGAAGYRYDPKNQADPGGRRIVHRRYLELDLPGGRFSTMNSAALTVFDDSPPDVRELWFVVGEDASWTLDGTIIYPRPGSMNGKESIRIEAPGLQLQGGGAHLYMTGREVEITLEPAAPDGGEPGGP